MDMRDLVEVRIWGGKMNERWGTGCITEALKSLTVLKGFKWDCFLRVSYIFFWSQHNLISY